MFRMVEWNQYMHGYPFAPDARLALSLGMSSASALLISGPLIGTEKGPRRHSQPAPQSSRAVAWLRRVRMLRCLLSCGSLSSCALTGVAKS